MEEYFELLENKNAITDLEPQIISYNDRIYFLCNDDIGDEFHYVLRCLSRKLLLLLLTIITIM